MVAALSICLPFFIKKKYLLLYVATLTFFNYAQLKGGPSWSGLLPSLLVTTIIYIRLFTGRVNKKIIVRGVILLLISLYFVIFFFNCSYGTPHEKTAIKSIIQYGILAFNILFLLHIDDDYRDFFWVGIQKLFPTFIVFYFLISVGFGGIGENGRYDGYIGAQALALSLTLLVAYFSIQGRLNTTLMFLMLVAITGSRTYMGISCVIFAIALFNENRFKQIKPFILIFTIASVYILPVILESFSSRFIVNDDFFGTLLGRLPNYEAAWLMINSNPFFGNGFGSMVYTLKYWVVEGYMYYLSTGDTTIVHNEYLRIIVEIGFGGFLLITYFILLSYRYIIKTESKIFLFIIAAGSLLENTISLYSTGMLLFILLYIMSLKKAV